MFDSLACTRVCVLVGYYSIKNLIQKITELFDSLC